MPIKPNFDDINRQEDILKSIIPKNSGTAYDMKIVIIRIVDLHSFFELSPEFAKNIIIGFSRMNGRTIGVVANQPFVSSGVLDINSSVKAARFVRFCDAFNIPLVTFVDGNLRL